MIGSIPPNVRNRRKRKRSSLPGSPPLRAAVNIGGARRALANDRGAAAKAEPPRIRVIEPTPKKPAPPLRDLLVESFLDGGEVVVIADITRMNGEKLNHSVDGQRFTVCLGDRSATCELPEPVGAEPTHSSINNGILEVHYATAAAHGR